MRVAYNILIWTAARWRPNLEFSSKALTQLWGFGFRMFLSGLLEAIFKRLDFLIIGKLFAPATLGYFQRAKSLNSLAIQYSSGSLMAVLFPVLSKIKNDLPRFQNVIMKSLGIISFVVFLLLGSLYLTSEELIVLLFSEKWLPSVDFFKILVLSGFGHPISALLVNVLSSRGNSTAFLRLQIYKKIILSINFIVLYFFGINAYLYGLVVTSTLSVSLNIFFASREIKLPFYLFVKPIIIQMSITVIAALLTIEVTRSIELMGVMMILIKCSLFTLLYLVLNIALRTTSFRYAFDQMRPIINKKIGGKIGG
ncbi:MAG: oligosaccharide flippase family protein, partial [Bacteroidota bacterium]